MQQDASTCVQTSIVHVRKIVTKGPVAPALIEMDWLAEANPELLFFSVAVLTCKLTHSNSS